jgi:hypothetical protein
MVSAPTPRRFFISRWMASLGGEHGLEAQPGQGAQRVEPCVANRRLVAISTDPLTRRSGRSSSFSRMRAGKGREVLRFGRRCAESASLALSAALGGVPTASAGALSAEGAAAHAAEADFAPGLGDLGDPLFEDLPFVVALDLEALAVAFHHAGAHLFRIKIGAALAASLTLGLGQGGRHGGDQRTGDAGQDHPTSE